MKPKYTITACVYSFGRILLPCPVEIGISCGNFSTIIPYLWISQPPENQPVLLYLQSAKFAGDCLNVDLEGLVGFLGNGGNPHNHLNPSKSWFRQLLSSEQNPERSVATGDDQGTKAGKQISFENNVS